MVLMTGVGFTAASDEPKCDKQQAVAKALDSFSGSWEIVKMSPDGAKGAKRLLFKRDGTYAAVDEEGKKLWVGMFEIYPTANPNMWDHRSRAGTKRGSGVPGIYELGADSLKMACVVGQCRGEEWVGKGRPKTFDPRVADVVIEMRRANTNE